MSYRNVVWDANGVRMAEPVKPVAVPADVAVQAPPVATQDVRAFVESLELPALNPNIVNPAIATHRAYGRACAVQAIEQWKAEIMRLTDEYADNSYADAMDKRMAFNHRRGRTALESKVNALAAEIAALQHDITGYMHANTAYVNEIEGAQKDAERWRAVRRNRKLQGSLNGYSTFTQTVDAAIAKEPK